jgi:hypothetical protein
MQHGALRRAECDEAGDERGHSSRNVYGECGAHRAGRFV